MQRKEETCLRLIPTLQYLSKISETAAIALNRTQKCLWTQATWEAWLRIVWDFVIVTWEAWLCIVWDFVIVTKDLRKSATERSSFLGSCLQSCLPIVSWVLFFSGPEARQSIMVEGAGLVTPGNDIISWGPSFHLCTIGGMYYWKTGHSRSRSHPQCNPLARKTASIVIVSAFSAVSADTSVCFRCSLRFLKIRCHIPFPWSIWQCLFSLSGPGLTRL